MKTDKTINLKLNLSYLTIFVGILCLHLLLLFLPHLKNFSPQLFTEAKKQTPLIIKNIRKVGVKNSKSKNDVYLSQDKTKKSQPSQTLGEKLKSLHELSSADLSMKKDLTKSPPLRPGTIPLQRPKSISGIGLRGNQMKKFIESGTRGVTYDEHSSTLSNSDVAVNLEVPEGVSPDELNKFELMFYSFQRRTAINYINSFYKNLDKFKQSNPHLQFPMTDSKQIMTGRLTYDEKGNIKQIKMIRWSNIEKLQDFFLDVLKDMDTLHNPPQALWKQTGEFSIYFSFIVNG